MSSLAYRLPEDFNDTSETSIPSVRPSPLKKTYSASPLCREAEAVSPFAIAGFLLACVLVVMVLLSHIQLDQINTETTALSSELSTLQEEYEDLSAKYEQLFDMESIKSDLLASGSMIQITSEQQIYIDLSQPDSTTVYEDDLLSEDSILGSAVEFLLGLFE